MANSEFAPGLPDPRRFGRVTELPTDTPLRYVIQRHLAQRAGPHYDIRLGPDQGHKPTMLSWAARHLPEQPGEKRMAFQQPLHTGAYADFEGEIVSGYGKGTVATHDNGNVIVTKVTPNKINFAVIHKKHPETFVLVRKSGRPMTPQTAREARTQGGSWLMINTTPTDVIKHNKVHYTTVPAEEISKLFDEEYLHDEKIDGAAALYKVLADRIEVLSYRPTTDGRPIVHTYRVGGTTNIDIPKHLVGSVLRGELYGVRRSTGEAIPAQELGGILNATTLKSLQKQREQGVELKSRLFNVLQHGNEPVSMDSPVDERMEKLREIAQHLPPSKYTLPTMAGTPEEQKQLWERVTSGNHPLTREGIVAWPRAGGKPTKVKLYADHDVFVREIFPGGGKLEGTGAGGFGYSLEPEGPIVGRVGTGFSDATRKQMWETPEEYKGRVARIKAQGQFPSGAYRAPAFLALHEDYPGKEASLIDREVDVANTHPAARAVALIKSAYADPRLAMAYQNIATPTGLGGVAGELATTGAFMPALGTAGAVGQHLLGRGTGTLAANVASKWAPSAIAKGMGSTLGAAAIPLSAIMELGFNNIPDALQDPRYKAGQIGLLRAMGGSIGRSAEAQQAKTQDAYKNGLLSGAASSALGGVTNPISTVTGLGQAAWRAAKMPFSWLFGSKQSSDGILTPIIKKAVDDLGGEGDSMEALVKAAIGYNLFTPPQFDVPPATESAQSEARASAPQLKSKETTPVTFGNKVRGFFLGMDPKTVQSLQHGAKSIASVLEKLRSVNLLPTG